MRIIYHSAMRRTRHFQAVEALLSRTPGALSAEEVHSALRESGVGVATVYRILNRGVEAGLFRPVSLADGPTRFEPADRPHHHHFACSECDRVIDLAGCPGRFERMLPEGFELESHDLLLRGRCADCREGAA